MSELRNLATFFDRHGSITLAPQESGAVKVRIAVLKASPVVLKRFKDTFKVGSVGGYPQRPNPRYYMYYAYASNAKVVLEALLPFLEAKKREAEIAVEILELQHYNGVPYTATERATLSSAVGRFRAERAEFSV